MEDIAAGNIEEDEDEEATKGKEREEESKDGGEEARQLKSLLEKLRVSAITALGNAFPSTSTKSQSQYLEEHCRFFLKHVLTSIALYQVPILQALSRCIRVLISPPSSASTTEMDVEGKDEPVKESILSSTLVRDILSACWNISGDTKVSRH